MRTAGRTDAETTYVFGSVVHLPLSGRRWQRREEARERGAGRRVGSREETVPRYPCHPAVPAHLGICQHDVLDARWPAGLGAFHAYIVDLVAADLPVLPAGRGRAPQHSDGRGVERLRLHLPRGRAGHWRAGGGRRGCYRGARPCPRPGDWAAAGPGGRGPLQPLRSQDLPLYNTRPLLSPCHLCGLQTGTEAWETESGTPGDPRAGTH